MQIGVQFKKDLTEITEQLKNEKNANDRKELGLSTCFIHRLLHLCILNELISGCEGPVESLFPFSE